MKIALLADIHGNDLALEAVLDDIAARGGVDGYWILGDLVAIGHAPIKVLERLTQLPNARFLRGNTERYVCDGHYPPPTFAEVKSDWTLLGQLVEVAGCFAWTLGAVMVAGWLDWLKVLPIEFRETLPDGTAVLCVHASPGTDDGPGFRETMSQKEISSRLGDTPEDLICVGHTHQPFSMRVDGKHLVNPGSVSNPATEDVRACYAVIDAAESSYSINFFRVDYDQAAVMAILEQTKHPAREFIAMHLRGEWGR